MSLPAYVAMEKPEALLIMAQQVMNEVEEIAKNTKLSKLS
jgi:hypothetical protein